VSVIRRLWITLAAAEEGDGDVWDRYDEARKSGKS
jgi:hypothetical protein